MIPRIEQFHWSLYHTVKPQNVDCHWNQQRLSYVSLSYASDQRGNYGVSAEDINDPLAPCCGTKLALPWMRSPVHFNPVIHIVLDG